MRFLIILFFAYTMVAILGCLNPWPKPPPTKKEIVLGLAWMTLFFMVGWVVMK